MLAKLCLQVCRNSAGILAWAGASARTHGAPRLTLIDGGSLLTPASLKMSCQDAARLFSTSPFISRSSLRPVAAVTTHGCSFLAERRRCFACVYLQTLRVK